MDTIFALSSGAAPAGIAVLRISGMRAFEAARALAGTLPGPRVARLSSLRDPESEDLLDKGIVLLFPGPASATGEDIAELHLHGGRAVVRAVERALERLPGLRRADPGEFTRRALLQGRIDLSEAEGLGDLLMAETESQRRVALRSAEGEVRREVENWTMRVLALSAQVEALLDHADEADVEDATDSPSALQAEARSIAADIEDVVARPPVERLRDGIRVVLAGPPNAGKSTLLNALVQRDAAIVSPIAGTTRDRIEAPVVRDGIAMLLIDTAGLADQAGDAIEAIGMARTHDAVAGADILLGLGEEPPAYQEAAAIWIHARADQPERRTLPAGRHVSVSAVSGEGVDRLWDRLTSVARELLPPLDMIALNQRQRVLCASAAHALGAATCEDDLLLFAEHLRSARRAFDAVTGRADVEAMLDALFSRFCIGK